MNVQGWGTGGNADAYLYTTTRDDGSTVVVSAAYEELWRCEHFSVPVARVSVAPSCGICGLLDKVKVSAGAHIKVTRPNG